MNENKRSPYPRSAFNYTLLLDDVIELNLSSFQDSSFDLSSSERSIHCDTKFGNAECKTQLIKLDSEKSTEIESPLKMSSSKNTKEERLRKSDGGLPWNYKNKDSKILDFLTETSDNEDDDFLNFETEMRTDLCETRSDITRKNISNFSLSSCFKNNFSHFDESLGISSKSESRNTLKIRGEVLKQTLKKRQFDNIIGKLCSLIENGRICPT
jgi:hypothetical protein